MKKDTLKRRKENRLTVVNWNGRICEFWNAIIEESIQDDGRTLKLFIKKNEDNRWNIKKI